MRTLSDFLPARAGVLGVSKALFSFSLSVFCLGSIANAQTADAPTPLQIGVTAKGEIARDASHYFKIALPAGEYKVIYDARRASGEQGNLINRVSLLDADGVVVTKSLARMNEIAVSWRTGDIFTLKKAATVGLRLANDHDPVEFWLTLLRADTKTLVPFFGAVSPVAITLDATHSGTLGRGDSAYLLINLLKGNYKAIFEMTNAGGEKTNLIGYLAALQSDGTNQKRVARINEIDVTFRTSAALAVAQEGATILRVTNVGGASGKAERYRSHYSVKITTE